MNILFILLIISGILLIILMLKKMKLAQIILCIFSGLAALFCCDLIFSFTGTAGMPINPYTLTISAIGGIPGVILLVLLNILTV